MRRWKWIAAIGASAAFLYGITFIGAKPAPPTVGIKGAIFRVIDLRYDPDRRFPVVKPEKSLPEDGAILCSWDRDRYLHFFPVHAPGGYDVAFLDADGKILEIQALRSSSVDFLEDAGVSSNVQARRAIFLAEGTATKMKLAIGDVVRIPSALASGAEPMPVIKVDGHALHVEVMERAWQRNRGLMHRPTMSKDEGMLFMYPQPMSNPFLSFYMRNTLMSLDIAYFDDQGKLLNVRPTQRAKNPAVDGANIQAPAIGPAQFVLEVPIGWFQERGLIDADGKPVKPVTMELTADLLRRARQAEGR